MTNTTERWIILFVRLFTNNEKDRAMQINELSKIQKALENKGFQVEAPEGEASTFLDLVKKIDDYRPNIVHLSGHGSSKSVEFSSKIVAGEPRKSIPLSAEDINKIFKAIPEDVKPRLLFINTCFASNIAHTLEGLENNSFNCLIGMQNALNPNLALDLAESFYKFIADGLTVEKAQQKWESLILASKEKSPNKEGFDPQPTAYGDTTIKFTPRNGLPVQSSEEAFSPYEWEDLCKSIRRTNKKTSIYSLESLLLKPELKIHLQPLPAAVKQTEGRDLYLSTTNTSSEDLINDQLTDDREKETLLILGNHSSGKTIILWTMLKKFSEDSKNFIPVYLNLSSWRKQWESFDRWLEEKLHTEYGINRKNTRNLLTEGKLILLLDGLDQIKVDVQKNFIENFNKFISEERKPNQINKIILASRLLDYEKILGGQLKVTEINLSKKYLLQLDRAFCIEPLSVEYMVRYFNKEQISNSIESWKKILNEHDEFRTPLATLFISKSGIKLESLPTDSTSEEIILNFLRNEFVTKMFDQQRQYNNNAAPGVYYKSMEETKKFLKYLAKNLKNQDRSIFKIEQIQPMWLSSKRCVFGYRILTGITVGLILGIIAGLYFIFYLKLIKQENIINPSLVLKLITVGLSSGLIAGVIQGVVCYYPNIMPSVEPIFSTLSRQSLLQKGKAALEELFSTLSRQSLFQKGKAAFEELFSILSRQRFFQEGKAALEELFSTLSSKFIRGAIPGISFALFLFFGLKSGLLAQHTCQVNNQPESINISDCLGLMPIYLCGFFSTVTFSGIDETIQIPLIGRIKWLKLLMSCFIVTVSGLFYVMLKYGLYKGFDLGNPFYPIFEIFMFIIIGLLYGGFQIMVIDENKEKQKRGKSNQGIRRLGKLALLLFGIGLLFGMIASSLADRLNFVENLRFLVCLGMATGLLAGLGGYEGAGIVCIQHFILRLILYIDKKIPWNYTRFLDYAHQQGFLLSPGDAYWFASGLLDYFADVE